MPSYHMQETNISQFLQKIMASVYFTDIMAVLHVSKCNHIRQAYPTLRLNKNVAFSIKALIFWRLLVNFSSNNLEEVDIIPSTKIIHVSLTWRIHFSKPKEMNCSSLFTKYRLLMYTSFKLYFEYFQNV